MAKNINGRKRQEHKQIALERIELLFSEARDMFGKNKALAKRYVALARELSMKYKVPIPSNLKRQFCKHCGNYLMPSVNVRVRTRNGKIVYYCLDCKHFTRFPYLREQKAKRKMKIKVKISK
jgi:ribonuclease P protein subunit RPR2